ncbi:DNA polymerase IV [uncultured Jatrophihabitans sp.]|uniref:DNA polymerase IV n=1 Tax=uncultured Jatrophihabitans sp. TaxID=1610747 RepID=UPI0035C9B2B6
MGRSADLPRTAGRWDGDDTGCTMLHVDMDAFFASVEIKRRPELRGRPVVVGGGQRGVVAAASYEARVFGVRSAMAMSQALRLCPRAVVLPPDRAAYSAASQQVMSILRDVTPLVEPLSLDEAFLDVAGAIRVRGRPGAIAAAIRAQVEERLQLTCSVGVAPTKFVAKLASARCKPDGMLVVPAARVLDFLHPLPVTALWGVGARTAEPLHRLGIRTVGDLDATPLDTLRRAVGAAAAEHLSALAAGLDPRPVQPHEVEKSISSDRTLDVDLTAEADVRRELLRLSEEVGSRVRDRDFAARTIGIKIRFADFRTVTRVRTLPNPTAASSDIFRVAAELYRGLSLDRPRVRLVGVKAEGLVAVANAVEQLALDWPPAPAPAPAPAPEAAGPSAAGPSAAGARRVGRASSAAARERPRRGEVYAALDSARERFGPAAVRPASLLASPEPTPAASPEPSP